MNIELQRAFLPEDMNEQPCAVCAESFVRGSVSAQAEAVEVGGSAPSFIGAICPACIECLGRRSPERFPTIEEYEEALRRYPEPMWETSDTLDRLFRESPDAYCAALDEADLDREDLRSEPSEEGIYELIRKTDAFTDCKTVLIDAVKVAGGPPERWNNIRKHVFPVLRRESTRLEKEVDSYKEALEA